MTSMYLTRLAVRRDVALSTILPLLIGTDGASPHAGKALMWSAFHQGEESRDFLWREDSSGVFYALAPRSPSDAQGLFSVEPPKVFEPEFQSGDRLDFKLRVNPVIRRSRRDGTGKSRKHDVMMDALFARGDVSRREHRDDDARDAVLKWLAHQGGKSGFEIDPESTVVSGVRQHEVPRPAGQKTMKFTSVDIDGQLVVLDPPAFVQALHKGFGAAKAYGCGLMLVRRPW